MKKSNLTEIITLFPQYIESINKRISDIINQEIKTTEDKIEILSACRCTPHRKDLIAVATPRNEDGVTKYYLVQSALYDSSHKVEDFVYFTGSYVEVNEDMFNLTTTSGYSKEAFDELFEYTDEQYTLLMNWFKSLKLD